MRDESREESIEQCKERKLALHSEGREQPSRSNKQARGGRMRAAATAAAESSEKKVWRSNCWHQSASVSKEEQLGKRGQQARGQLLRAAKRCKVQH